MAPLLYRTEGGNTTTSDVRLITRIVDPARTRVAGKRHAHPRQHGHGGQPPPNGPLPRPGHRRPLSLELTAVPDQLTDASTRFEHVTGYDHGNMWGRVRE